MARLSSQESHFASFVFDTMHRGAGPRIWLWLLLLLLLLQSRRVQSEEESSLPTVLTTNDDISIFRDFWVDAVPPTTLLPANATWLVPVNTAQDAPPLNFVEDPSWRLHLDHLLHYHVFQAADHSSSNNNNMGTVLLRPALLPYNNTPEESDWHVALLTQTDDTTAVVGSTDDLSSGATETIAVVVEIGTEIDNVNLTATPAVVHKIDRYLWPRQLTRNLNKVVGSLTDQRLPSFLHAPDMLSRPNQTVLVPTLQAWQAVPAPIWSLLADSPAAVEQLWSNHIVEGVYPIVDQDGDEAGLPTEIKTASGAVWYTEKHKGQKWVGENAMLQSINHLASNGLAHSIDQVLLRPREFSQFESAPVSQVIMEHSQLTLVSTLLQSVGELSDLLFLLDGCTVFAPRDDGTVKIDPKFLLPAWRPHLRHLLRFHIVPGETMTYLNLTTATTTAAGDGKSIELQSLASRSTSELSLWIRTRHGKLTLRRVGSTTTAQIEQSDVNAANGVIHTVDNWLEPFLLQQSLLYHTQSSIAPLFAQLVVASGTEGLLTAENRTVFLPRITGDEYVDSAEWTMEETVDVVKNHICDGVYPRSALLFLSKEGATAELVTLGNQTLNVNSTGPDRFAAITLQGKLVEGFDKVSRNGLAHVVDGLLFYPTTDMSTGMNSSNMGEDVTEDGETFEEPVAPFAVSANQSLNMVLTEYPNLSIFFTLLEGTGLINNLAASSPPSTNTWTVWAPENSAWESPNWMRFLGPEWRMHLMELLEYHISVRAITTDVIGSSKGSQLILTTLASSELWLEVSNTSDGRIELLEVSRHSSLDILPSNFTHGNRSILTNDTVTIQENLTTSIVAVSLLDQGFDNGVIQQLGGLLMPWTLTRSLWDLVDMVSGAGTFRSLVVQFGMEHTVRAHNRTVLVPVDEAWEKNFPGFLEAEESFVRKTVERHICVGIHPLTLFRDGYQLETIAGELLMVSSDAATGQWRLDESASVVIGNRLGSHGIAHILDTVILKDALSTPEGTKSKQVQLGVSKGSRRHDFWYTVWMWPLLLTSHR